MRRTYAAGSAVVLPDAEFFMTPEDDLRAAIGTANTRSTSSSA